MQGQYDRVHVGASCPPDRLAALLPLLRPQGGIIVTPVSPNDLRMIKVNAGGDVTQKVISQVRYSELEVLKPTPCTLCCLICILCRVFIRFTSAKSASCMSQNVFNMFFLIWKIFRCMPSLESPVLMIINSKICICVCKQHQT